MQSHLEAALLGHSSGASAPSVTEDEDKEEPDDEADDADEFIDEEYDGDSVNRGQKGCPSSSGNASGRNVTLQMLLAANILQPGEGSMSIEYLGQRFIGDLLADGKIKSQETDIVFASPSAWAIHCKRIINPDKKSGCGWASVKYKGRKLDAYKSLYYKKKREEEHAISEDEMEINEPQESKSVAPVHIQRIVVKHNTIANRTFTHDANTLVECVPFSNLGKIQPFLISISTNAVLVMDFHCHLSLSEVSGYLAGQWDVNAHNLSVTHAFPCCVRKGDREHGHQVEMEIQKAMEQQHLTLVGWYHSHPTSAAAPTLRDIDAQLEYEIRMKGNSDTSYSPCIGLICSPYNSDISTLESNIICYWVIPPPETKPNEYGRPMLMSYTVIQDAVLSPNIMDEMKQCADFYKNEKPFMNFHERFNSHSTYLDKLKASLTSKFPREQNETLLWGYMKELIGIEAEDKVDTSALLTIPNIKTQMMNPLMTPLTTPNYMLTSDLASVLFQSGKFPSTSSLLGIPDPLSRSTLAANNMFLSPSLFKMQDLLKPLCTSSPIPGTSKSPDLKLSQPLKVPTDIKTAKIDFTDLNLLALKSKLDFGTELNLPKMDFSSPDLSVSSSSKKIDFTASDLSISSIKKTDTSIMESLKGKNYFSTPPPPLPPSTKGSKADFATLDLSMPSGDHAGAQSDSSIDSVRDSSNNPLNLVSE